MYKRELYPEVEFENSKQLPRVIDSFIAGEVEVFVTAALTTSNALFTVSLKGPSILVFKPAASRVVRPGIRSAATLMELAEAVNNLSVSDVAVLVKQIMAG